MASDVEIQAREILRAAGGRAWIVAKIEWAEAIEALDEILNAFLQNRQNQRRGRPAK